MVQVVGLSLALSHMLATGLEQGVALPRMEVACALGLEPTIVDHD